MKKRAFGRESCARRRGVAGGGSPLMRFSGHPDNCLSTGAAYDEAGEP